MYRNSIACFRLHDSGDNGSKKKNTKKTGKTVRGMRGEGEMLARFFCSSMLTESLVQASTGRNVAQSRSQGLKGLVHDNAHV